MKLFPKLRPRIRPGPELSAPAQNEPPLNRDIGFHDAYVRGWFNTIAGELFAGFPIGPDDVVADIGCGEGGNAAFCAKLGARLILADIDPKNLDRATARVTAEPNNGGVETYLTGSDPLPIESGAATRIICTEVIEHVDDPARLLAELHRIGRPGALYLLSCPDSRSEEIQKRVAAPAYFQKPNHIRIIQPDEFAGYVEAAGLVVEARNSHGFYQHMWWVLYWATDGSNEHPLLNHWTRTWQTLLDLPYGNAIKGALDDLAPKSQIIIARKPE